MNSNEQADDANGASVSADQATVYSKTFEHSMGKKGKWIEIQRYSERSIHFVMPIYGSIYL